MLTAPLHGALESFMILVGTDSKHVEIYLLYDLVNITILHHTVDISHRLDHIHTFLSIIDELAIWLVLQHNVRTLHGNGEMVANLSGATEQLHMPDVQQIIDTNSKYSLHLIEFWCKITKLFLLHKIISIFLMQ